MKIVDDDVYLLVQRKLLEEQFNDIEKYRFFQDFCED